MQSLLAILPYQILSLGYDIYIKSKMAPYMQGMLR